MALVVKDRIKEVTATTGTGTLTLNGASAGFQSFSVIGDTNTTYYTITSGTDWEVGIGTYTASGTTLSRDTILESSNAGAAINLSSISTVFCTYPAEKSVSTADIGTIASQDANNVSITAGSIAVTADPTTPLQVATKDYVDNLVSSSIHFHEPVRLETPDSAGNLNATYDNGTAGVGATLTNNSTQVALTIDGVTTSTSDRILVYNQTDATENGVYVVTDVGSGSTNWVLTRSADANTSGDGDSNSLDEGSYFLVTEGDTGAGESYVCNTAGIITFGTTDITFAQFSSSLNYIAGTNIDITGRTISVEGDIAVADGGTGSSTASGARTNLGVPSTSGTGATGTWGISITGNAATVTNGVYTTGTYANPAWITSLDDSKVLPSMTGNSGRLLTTDGTNSSWITATSSNTPNAIVSRNGSGNFSAGTITATLSGNATTSSSTSGNAATATVLQTARTIGGVSFNGSANINLPGVNTTGNQNTSGNATTATRLQTARNINGVSFNGSANITVEPYIENDDGTNATRYMVFTDNSTAGFKRLNEDSNLTYNPSTNILTTSNLQITSGGLIKDVTGNYGSIEVDGGATGGYEGYSIGGRVVFMHNNTTTTGIYNDVNNHWLMRAVHGGATSLYYNGAEKLQTTNTGIAVTGTCSATSFTGSASGLTGIPAPAALTTASGSAPSYSARAWVNFNGVGAVSINGSGNVSSIQDLGVGRYRVNFSTAMQDANYAIALGASSDSATANRSMNENNLSRTASRCDVTVCDMNGGEFDENRLSVSIIR